MSEIVPHDFLRQEIEMPKVEIVSSATAAIEASRRVIEIVLGKRIDFIDLTVKSDRKARSFFWEIGGCFVKEVWTDIHGQYVLDGNRHGIVAPFSGKVLCRQIQNSLPQGNVWFPTDGSPLSTFVIERCGYLAMWTYLVDGPLRYIDVSRRRLHDAEEVSLERYEGTDFSNRRLL